MPHQIVDSRNRQLGRILRGRQTPAEKRLWARLRNRALDGLRFRRQAPIGPYIVDFFCPELKLAVELDGSQHTRFRAAQRDISRDEWLAVRGIHTLRFTNRDVLTRTDDVCGAIVAEALAMRQSRAGGRSP